MSITAKQLFELPYHVIKAISHYLGVKTVKTTQPVVEQRYLLHLWLTLNGILPASCVHFDANFLTKNTIVKTPTLRDLTHVDICFFDFQPINVQLEPNLNAAYFTAMNNFSNQDLSDILIKCRQLHSLTLTGNDSDYKNYIHSISQASLSTPLTILECEFTGITPDPALIFYFPNLKLFFGHRCHLSSTPLDDDEQKFQFNMPKLHIILLRRLDLVFLQTTTNLLHIHLENTQLNLTSETTIYPRVVTIEYVCFFVREFTRAIEGPVCFSKTKFLATNTITDFYRNIWVNLEVLLLVDFHADYNNEPGASYSKINFPPLPHLKLLLHSIDPSTSVDLSAFTPDKVTVLSTHNPGYTKWLHLLECWIQKQNDPLYIIDIDDFENLRSHLLTLIS